LFILLVTAVTLPDCSGSSVRENSETIKAVAGSNHTVKSSPVPLKYSERPVTVLKSPSNYKPAPPDKVIIGDDNIRIILYAREFAQGNAGYFEADREYGKICKINKCHLRRREYPFHMY
jgi:hypothetical protein